MVAHASRTTDTILGYLTTNFANECVEITADTPLKSIESLDSIARLELILFIEETFGIAVRDEDVTLETFYSVATISDFITRRVETD